LADIFEEVSRLLRREGVGGCGYYEILVVRFTSKTPRTQRKRAAASLARMVK
jgi:hypothetical protein